MHVCAYEVWKLVGNSGFLGVMEVSFGLLLLTLMQRTHCVTPTPVCLSEKRTEDGREGPAVFQPGLRGGKQWGRGRWGRAGGAELRDRMLGGKASTAASGAAWIVWVRNDQFCDIGEAAGVHGQRHGPVLFFLRLAE